VPIELGAFAASVPNFNREHRFYIATDAALAKHPKIFSEFFVNLVRTGEAGGHLAQTLDQLATYLGGKAAVEQWFFGQVMKRLQGRGNPQVIRKALGEQLERLKREA